MPADCKHDHPLKVNQRDPTQTTTLRRKFAGEAFKRWRKVKGLVRESIVKNDALAIKGGTTNNQSALPNRELSNDENKSERFMDWFEQTSNEVVIGSAAAGVYGSKAWTDDFVERAYVKGQMQANQKLKNAGFNVSDFSENDVFSTKEHRQSLNNIQEKTFREMKGVSEATQQQVNRELIQGLQAGAGTQEMASLINERVDKIGITRSRQVARTETIRAHHEATLDRFEAAGVREVETQAEWITAGDARVCPRCLGQEGKVRTIKEQRGLIPLHVNCRCSVLPVTDDFGSRSDEEIARTKDRVRKRRATRKRRDDSERSTGSTTSSGSGSPEARIKRTLGDDYESRVSVHLHGGGDPETGGKGWLNGSKTNKQTVRIKRAAKQEFDDVDGTIRTRSSYNFDDAVEQKTRQDVRKIHERFLEDAKEFKDLDPDDTITLYRGVGNKRVEEDTVSSWTQSEKVAKDFAKDEAPAGSSGFVKKREVKVKDILTGRLSNQNGDIVARDWVDGKFGDQAEFIVMNRRN